MEFVNAASVDSPNLKMKEFGVPQSNIGSSGGSEKAPGIDAGKLGSNATPPTPQTTDSQFDDAPRGAPLITSDPRMPPPVPGLENNPGNYEDLHKRCKEVFPMLFDGAKLMINKAMSNHFQVSHTISLSPVSSGYRFGATYVGSEHKSASEAYPVLLGDTDFSGNVSGTVIHHLTERIRVRYQAQSQSSKMLGTQLITDYRAPAYTSSLTIVNPNLVTDSGILVASYLRRIYSRLDLGMEMTYSSGKAIPGGQVSSLSYALRYLGDSFMASVALGGSSLHASYYHRQQENYQFGVEWETNFRMGESIATFGYQLDLPKVGTTFRAQADSQWNVGAVLEKKLLPFPFTLALSGTLNHIKQQSRFGIGLVIG